MSGLVVGKKLLPRSKDLYLSRKPLSYGEIDRFLKSTIGGYPRWGPRMSRIVDRAMLLEQANISPFAYLGGNALVWAVMGESHPTLTNIAVAVGTSLALLEGGARLVGRYNLERLIEVAHWYSYYVKPDLGVIAPKVEDGYLMVVKSSSVDAPQQITVFRGSSPVARLPFIRHNNRVYILNVQGKDIGWMKKVKKMLRNVWMVHPKYNGNVTSKIPVEFYSSMFDDSKQERLRVWGVVEEGKYYMIFREEEIKYVGRAAVELIASGIKPRLLPKLFKPIEVTAAPLA